MRPTAAQRARPTLRSNTKREHAMRLSRPLARLRNQIVQIDPAPRPEIANLREAPRDCRPARGSQRHKCGRAVLQPRARYQTPRARDLRPRARSQTARAIFNRARDLEPNARDFKPRSRDLGRPQTYKRADQVGLAFALPHRLVNPQRKRTSSSRLSTTSLSAVSRSSTCSTANESLETTN